MNPNDPNNKRQGRIKMPQQQPQFSESSASSNRPFSKGWKYYAGMTVGIFLGAIAANVILSFVFKRRSFDAQNDDKPLFSVQSGYIKDGEKHYYQKTDAYSEL